MNPFLPGLTVIRAIPPDVLYGLQSGQYKLYGGVIRGVAGTSQAGQIICHLLPVPNQTTSSLQQDLGLAQQPGIHLLQSAWPWKADALTITHHVLETVSGTMLLSGLNLLVTTVGFALLGQKLQRLEAKLNQIGRQVREIRTLLELEERARWGAAIRDLQGISAVNDPDTRRLILVNQRQVLAQIAFKYRELLAMANSVEAALACEEYYCLAALAEARCYAELAELDLARQKLTESTVYWQNQAQRIARELLLGKDPERFLFSDFVVEAPVSVLVAWLDFAHGEEEGYGRLDELRQKTLPWYRRSHRHLPPVRGYHFQKDTIISGLNKLVTRASILAGYVTQYELLATHQVTPLEFERQLAALASDAVDGYLILQPS